VIHSDRDLICTERGQGMSYSVPVKCPVELTNFEKIGDYLANLISALGEKNCFGTKRQFVGRWPRFRRPIFLLKDV
jgi:hypothetical protein